MCAARCHAESGHAPLPRACSLDCKFSASFELADSQLRAAPAPCWPHPFAVKTSAQRRPEASLVESAQGESALMNQRHQRGEKRTARTARRRRAVRTAQTFCASSTRPAHGSCPRLCPSSCLYRPRLCPGVWCSRASPWIVQAEQSINFMESKISKFGYK